MTSVNLAERVIEGSNTAKSCFNCYVRERLVRGVHQPFCALNAPADCDLSW